jgi:hypothetical protein
MLAFAAVSLLSLVTHQATRHGRPGFHPCNSGTPLIAITQRDPSAGHPPVIPLPAASGSSLSVKPRLYYQGSPWGALGDLSYFAALVLPAGSPPVNLAGNKARDPRWPRGLCCSFRASWARSLITKTVSG